MTTTSRSTEMPVRPVGRFQPTSEHFEGVWAGVPVCSLGEDGNLIAQTSDPARAVQAMNAYQRDVQGCMYDPESQTVTDDAVRLRWAYFESQPEDSDIDWSVHWAREGDDQAIELHYWAA
ncbi:hypothetical protein ACFVOR_37360 [Streptomyces sp. NPDC057837]|uniref:hypothetical protein n=1 Tax=Streptomyces sp. NPDC057837 TaxID=3346260 RepID=UPI0036807863